MRYSDIFDFCSETYGSATYQSHDGKVWLSNFICYCIARGDRGCANDPVNLRHSDPEVQSFIEEGFADVPGG